MLVMICVVIALASVFGAVEALFMIVYGFILFIAQIIGRMRGVE